MNASNPYCSICNIILEKDEKDGEDYQCPSCKAIYHPASEIMKHDDEVYFSHQDEAPELGGVSTEGSSLEAASDDNDPSILDMLHKSPKLKPNDGTGSALWDSEY